MHILTRIEVAVLGIHGHINGLAWLELAKQPLGVTLVLLLHPPQCDSLTHHILCLLLQPEHRVGPALRSGLVLALPDLQLYYLPHLPTLPRHAHSHSLGTGGTKKLGKTLSGRIACCG